MSTNRMLFILDDESSCGQDYTAGALKEGKKQTQLLMEYRRLWRGKGEVHMGLAMAATYEKVICCIKDAELTHCAGEEHLKAP